MKIGNIFLKTESDKKNDEKAFNILTIILVAVAILCGVSFILNFFENHNKGKFIFRQEQFYERNGHSEPDPTPVADDEYIPRKPNCTFWNCFNVYRCGQREQDRINIYVYPFKEYTDIASSKPAAILTKDYYQIIDTVLQSEYYTPNPNEACLFLPTIDLLNQNLVNLKLAGNALVSLDYWDGGENHLIFNMIPGGFPVFNRVLDVNTDKAIILGGGFDSWTYRPGFDISIPVWSPLLNDFDESKLVFDVQREYFLISAQMNMNKEFRNTLQYIGKEYSTDVLCLQACSKQSSSLSSKKIESVRCNSIPSNIVYDYPSILFKGTFCIVARGLRLGQPDFLEILAHNCIPVIVSDNYVLPFEDVIDWSLASIRIRENDLHSIIPKLREISNIKIIELKQQGRWLFRRYFNSLRAITLTALDILNDRVFPHLAKTNYQWNSISNNYRAAHNPLFLPLISPKSQGFTAVILTYDRIESLFTLIQKLAMVSSLQSILVIWNNQRKAPPHLSMFPRIMKPLKVIQTRANKLSNRFFPYDEIETEAILTIDDDIVMLTPDELNFGFEVWCEFPDRIVGFPSRIHLWDNSTNSWRYESEWTNQISMVLTGVAFHHKYWSYLYTNAMPGDIKDWVDEHMNCEDIAMNFLVANITRKPPIKVAPRKKFKCPECTNNEMLSADLNHMMERSACIDRFAQIYGHMPLKSVEFRADPVLYMDNFPEKLKRFNEIGSL